jgi:hypothetical protein
MEKQSALVTGLCVRVGTRACPCAYVHVALLIQHVTYMRHIATIFLAPQPQSHFRHCLINGAIFRQMSLNIKRVLIFSTTFVQNITHSKNNLARYCQKYETFSCKVHAILVGFL